MQPAEKTGRGPSGAAARALLPWAAAALAFFAVIAVFGLRYDTNDDAVIADIAAGAWGTGQAHLVFVNILLGVLLRPLYLLAPGVNWYVLCLLGAMYLGTAALCELSLRRCGTAGGLAVFAVLAAAVLPQMVCRLEHVRAAALCAVPALALLAGQLGKPLKACLPALLLALLGSLFRWEMFCAAGGLSAALLLGRFFALDKGGRRRAAGTVAVLLALVFAAKAADMAAYRLDSGWRAYTVYNEARSGFSDYAVLRLPYGVNAFADAGVTDTENAVLLSWDYYDPVVFPAARLAALSAAAPAPQLWPTVLDTLHTLRGMLWGSGARWALALLLAAGVLRLRFGRRSAPFWGTLAVLFAEVLALMWAGRWTRYVEFSLLLAALVFLGELLPAPAGRRGRAWAAAGAALVLLLTLPELPAQKAESDAYRAQHAAPSALDAIAEDKAHWYLADVESFEALVGSDVLHPRGEGYFSNIAALGGWLSHAPYCVRQLERAGLASPLPNAVDAPDVYVVSGHIDMLADFAAEQLGRPVRAERVPDRANVYRLVSG